MPLAAGTRLGPYELQSALGAGGMGEVYKARDTRLDRTVAVKVLPPDLAADSERRLRFEREARAVAALSHPHICVVHDVGRDGDVEYLVMEYLEGETLAARLERTKGPLPLEQTLRIGGEIADALDKAHRAGILHRDLKPANIILTRDGAKLLDFGLAKLRAPSGAIAASVDTRTGLPNTATGTILGTVHYMAPEQADGREADTRSDIWALGVVIYEMAAGARPFEGASAASVIAAILKDTLVPLASRQPLTPAALDHLVERCLDKDPDGRWQNAGDLKRELAWVARALSGTGTRAVSDDPRPRSTRWSRVAVTGLAIAVLAGVLAGGLASRAYVAADRSATTPTNLKFEVLPPPDATWSPAPNAGTAQLALSPDGSRLAFVVVRPGEPSRIWIRPLDRVDAQAVPGTEGAAFPFWSPDGRFIAFFGAGKLKKVDVALGTPQTLAEVAAGRGGSWSPAGVIVFGQSTSPLSQVPADGGPVTAATAFDLAQEPVWHYWPQFLPDGRRFLFLQRSVKPEHQGIYVGSLDSPQVTRLVAANVRGLFSSGHLLFMRDGLLFAQAFDLQALRVTGEPARIADGVGFYAAAFGYAAIDAANGVVAFGPVVRTSKLVQSLDRNGNAIGRSLEGPFASPRFAPDQQTVAVSVREAEASADIWTIDLARGLPSRVSSGGEDESFPTWMPDGRRVLFGSTRAPSSAGAIAIYQVTVGSSGADEPLDPAGSVRGFPNDVSSDSQFLLFHNLTQRGYDIGGASLVSGTPIDFLSTRFNEVQARFSPDRRSVAYASDESGRFEVYIREWPSAAERTLVSIGGGMQPEWRRDGKELFYLSADRKIMAVPITVDGRTVTVATPQALFPVDVAEPVAPFRNDYTVSGDGQRFVATLNAKAPVAQTLTVFYNWTTALQQ